MGGLYPIITSNLENQKNSLGSIAMTAKNYYYYIATIVAFYRTYSPIQAVRLDYNATTTEERMHFVIVLKP